MIDTGGVAGGNRGDINRLGTMLHRKEVEDTDGEARN
jgi:hypothetical protein